MKVNIILFSLLIINNLFGAHFDNILLIINYNHAHYDSLPLLLEMYEPYFENIVFYGPKKHPDVHFFEHTRGILSYLCIVDAMKRYPNFDGYFFLHDDCIFSPWLVQNIDTLKIWLCEMPYIFDSKGDVINLARGENAFSESGWWKSAWGWKAVEKAYKEIPESYKKILAQNYGERRVVAGFSDFVYIPAAYKEKFIALAAVFGKHKAFLEFAIPTIVACLCSKNALLWLKGNHTHLHYHDSFQSFKLNSHFNHPIKLSFEENRIFIRKLFSQH